MARRKRMNGFDYVLCILITLGMGILCLVRAIQWGDASYWIGFALSIPILIAFCRKAYAYFN